MLELAHLLRALLADPRSRLRAVVAGWLHPIDRAGLYQLDLIDVLLAHWSDPNKFQPVERPWDKSMPAKAGKSPEAAMRQLRPHLFKDES